jgi:hypothetical protein
MRYGPLEKRSLQVPTKIKAEDNPWYLVATLYGVPKEHGDELQAKNRAAWNRYFAAALNEETRRTLIEEKRHTGSPRRAMRIGRKKRLKPLELIFRQPKDASCMCSNPRGRSLDRMMIAATNQLP